LNAHLNISKLGAVGKSYRVNYYGETTSFLHRTGTDRLWVTWLLQSERVKERIAGSSVTDTSAFAEIPAVVRVGENEEPISTEQEHSGRQSLAIEIPENLNTLLKENLDLAIRWREATRNAFTKTMAAGFVVTEFCRMTCEGRKPGAYRLNRYVDQTL